VVTWIGYEVNLKEWRLGIIKSRAGWLIGWLRDRVRERTVDLSDLVGVLGRMAFAMGPLDFLKPSISPIYAWSSAVGPRGRARLPWSIVFLFELIVRALGGTGHALQIKPMVADIGEAFMGGREGRGDDRRGRGWDSMGGKRPEEARWFSVRLDTKSAPWAFARGEPFRTIAALEMYATLLSIILFSRAWPSDAEGEIKLTGATDNS